jgi:hypothetical protein
MLVDSICLDSICLLHIFPRLSNLTQSADSTITQRQVPANHSSQLVNVSLHGHSFIDWSMCEAHMQSETIKL